MTAGYLFPAVLQRSISQATEPQVNLTQTMIEVQDHVRRIESLPPCKRFASKKLVNSCLAFDSLQSENRYGADQSLERFRNLFALRVTYCELSDAQVSLPQTCQPFVDGDANDTGTENGFAECLHELHQTPSSWDSFNHAKTRATIICHAMRSEIDRDEQLHLFNLLFSTVSSMTNSLEGSRQEFSDARAIFHELRSSMRDFYIKLHSENDEVRAAIQQTWAVLETQLRRDMLDVADKLESIVGAMDQANINIIDFSGRVGQVLQSAADIGSEIQADRRNEVNQFRAAIEAGRDWFAFEIEMALRNFTQRIYGVTSDLQLANDLSGTMATVLNTNNDQLRVQIEHMAEMRSVSAALVNDQKSLHVEVMRRLGDISLKADQTLESLQAASEYAQQWKVALTFALDFICGSFLFRFAFYFGVCTAATLLWSFWFKIPWVMATMVSLLAGLGKRHA